MASFPSRNAILGCLLGSAVGDSVGLSCEGLSKRRQRRLFPEITGPSLLFRRGMVSDDTEHACMVAQALIASAGEVDAFTRSLARQLRVWLALLPAGVGFATLRAVVKLWLGISPTRSGVFSAGNGPAMRSPLLGVCFGHDGRRLGALVRASTRLTHTDPKAEYGALAAALAASMASRAPGARVTGAEYARELRGFLPADAGELLELVDRAVDSVAERRSTEAFAEAIGGGRGVSGYIYQTVPVVVHAWLAHQDDYRAAITAAIRCGGDTDTVAATLGGILGAGLGAAGLPADWLARLWEWPRSVTWMSGLGERLAEVAADGASREPLRLPVAGLLARNGFFLLVVLGHGFRRLLPPY